jgi:predicted dehydrogenase
MKFLVVGLGSMGKRRIRNLQQLGVAEIAGLDLREDRRAEAHALYGVTSFDQIEAAMQWGPDAVIVSTPPNLHLPFAQIAVDAGKHYFTEAGVSAEGFADLAAHAAEANLVGAPSCTMRFHPSIRKIKSLLAEGAIGRLLTFSHQFGQYLPDWHPWEDYRDYYVSQPETAACREIVPFELVWLTDLLGPVREVTAMKGRLGDLDADIDDVYHLLLRLGDKAIGHLQVDIVARAPRRELCLLGTEGNLTWSASDKTVRLYRSADESWQEYPEAEAAIEAGYTMFSIEDMYVDEMKAFKEACEGGEPYPYTFAEDAEVIGVLLAADRSAAQAGQKP